MPFTGATPVPGDVVSPFSFLFIKYVIQRGEIIFVNIGRFPCKIVNMKSRTVFEFTSYKPFMAHMLSGKDRRGQLTRAAESLRCQRSYLSRVISESLQLTPDHAFQLARFWKLGRDEREYFQALVDHERAGDPEFRAHLKQRVAELRRKHESVQERTARAALSVDMLQANYFSTWIWSAIHFLTSIPECQTSEALGDRLGLREEALLRYLRALEAQGLVESRNGRWIYRSGEFYVPRDSPLVILHHQNWRGRAVQDAQEPGNAGVHFTAVQTLSRSDFERIKELLLQFIAEASQIAGPSRPEEGIAITCDLFKI